MSTSYSRVPFGPLSALTMVCLCAGSACGGPASTSAGWGSDDGGAGSASDGAGNPGPASGECPPCMLDRDCASGAICAQFGGDTYCAPSCANGNACSADRSCATETSTTGQQVSVCVPRGDVCGGSHGTMDAGGGSGGTSGGGTGSSGSSGASGSSGGTTGSSGSSGTSSTGSSGTSSTGSSGSSGSGSGGSSSGASGSSSSGGTTDAGSPPSGSVGPGGGSVSKLYFTVVGDTRPANIDDTSGYPTAIITKIFQDLQALNPAPLFGVSTGDYMFASTTGAQAATQLDLYINARTGFSGTMFPAMGNHECTGWTNSNCGAGNADGITDNYTQFLTKVLQPLGQRKPYYAIRIDSTTGAWTAKFVFIAANAWDSAQSMWLAGELAKPTTYTFVLRHEAASANTAPGVTPSEQIMAQNPYTLAIVGHAHEYTKSGPKEVIIGNGGAPLTTSGSAVGYGFALVQQRADGAVQVDMIDYMTGQPDTSFRFAVNPDGSPAP